MAAEHLHKIAIQSIPSVFIFSRLKPGSQTPVAFFFPSNGRRKLARSTSRAPTAARTSNSRDITTDSDSCHSNTTSSCVLKSCRVCSSRKTEQDTYCHRFNFPLCCGDSLDDVRLPDSTASVVLYSTIFHNL